MTPRPGAKVQPATGWFPALKSTNLPRAAQNGIQQGFSLVYSLRDTVGQQRTQIEQLVQYDAHLARIQTNAQSMPDRAIWFESDRNTVFYQTRLQPNSTNRDWYYAGGIYFDVIGNRPQDLDNVHDVGFLFMVTHTLYRWSLQSDGTGFWEQVLP